MLKQRDGDPEVSKAEIEFNRVQKVEDQFHKDFDGLDSTYVDLASAASSAFYRKSFLEFLKSTLLFFPGYTHALRAPRP